MVNKIVEIERGSSLKMIGDVLVSQGITRRVTVKGNVLQAVGEAGIGIFYISQEGKNKLNIEARNNQALDIICNLVTVGYGRREIPAGEEIGKICSVCGTILEYLTEKSLGDDMPVKVMICPECQKLEFYLL
ncbi:MAG: hypothetical protein ACOWWO_10445 [Peptococcaceae bacterium]